MYAATASPKGARQLIERLRLDVTGTSIERGDCTQKPRLRGQVGERDRHDTRLRRESMDLEVGSRIARRWWVADQVEALSESEDLYHRSILSRPVAYPMNARYARLHEHSREPRAPERKIRASSGARAVRREPALPGALTPTFVRSLYAHARVVGVDVSAAAALPGTQVFTAADVDLDDVPPPPFPVLDQRMGRPFLAEDVVRFVGDIVAVVLTRDRADGRRRRRARHRRVRPAARRGRPARGARRTRCCSSPTPARTSARAVPVEADETLFDGCEVVVSDTLVSQRLAGVPARAPRVRRRGRTTTGG